MTTAHVKVRPGPKAHARTEIDAFLGEKRREIDAMFARYPDRRSGMLPLLWMLQHRFGWLSIPVQAAAARELGVAPAEVTKVVTFYHMFNDKPVGRFLVQVCGTLPCALAGAENVLTALEKELGVAAGETTDDGLFTLKRVECLGWCDLAPVVQVNEGAYDDKVSPEAAVAMVRRLRSEGRVS